MLSDAESQRSLEQRENEHRLACVVRDDVRDPAPPQGLDEPVPREQRVRVEEEQRSGQGTTDPVPPALATMRTKTTT